MIKDLIELKVEVNDRKKVVEKNKEIFFKGLMSRKKYFQKDLDAISLSGFGAKTLCSEMNDEELNEFFAIPIVSPHLIDRYGLAENGTLQDLIDSIGLYSQVKVEYTEKLAGFYRERSFTLIKECEETPGSLVSCLVRRIWDERVYTA